MFETSMIKFEGKHILITGASSGIGAGIAREFASRHANLYLTGRNKERLLEVCEECMSAGAASARAYIVDMASEGSITGFSASFDAPALDVLVLNAGISQRSTAFETDPSVDRAIMETDFFGPVRLTKELSRLIKAQEHCSIAVTTSISGLFGFPLRSAYCAAKHALFGFFESLELENENIRVTFLIPGRVNTPISKSALDGKGEKHGVMDAGQANGISVDKCARKAVRAIARGRHRKLIGGIELVMVYIKKWFPGLFFKIAGRVKAT